MVEAAHTYLLGKVAQVWQKVETGERVTLEDKRQLRLAASQATQLSAKAVDLLYNAAGGTALQEIASFKSCFEIFMQPLSIAW